MDKDLFTLLRANKNVFLTGAAGTGKSWWISKVKENFNVLLTSSTGISALNIGGNTIHSTLGLYLYKTYEEWEKGNITQLHFSRFKLGCMLDGKLLKFEECKHIQPWEKLQSKYLLIIDEISMIDGRLLDLMNKALKTILNNDAVFGGMQVMFVGDFFQLPPVDKENSFKYAFESDVWKELDLEIINLQENKRQDDVEFFSMLNKIRLGDNSAEVVKYFNDIQIENAKLPENETKLFATNKKAEDWNTFCLNKINKPEITIQALIVSDSDLNANKIKSWVIAPEVLKIKEGAKIIMLNNDLEGRWVNGSIGEIISIYESTLKIIIDGDIHIIDKYQWSLKNDKGNKVLATFTQYPMKLAYGITIHKSQGMTLSELEIDCKGIFELGQLYVALSRVKSKNKLKLINFTEKHIKVNEKVVNFYKGIEK